MGKIEEYRAKPPVIKGSTTINHNLRVKMKLTPTEYVLMDCFSELLVARDQVTDMNVYIKTGISPKDQVGVLQWLVKKGYIYPTAGKDNNPVLSKKWYDFFKGIEEEFTEFWTIDGKNCWPGSKPVALKLYTELRKTIPKEFIINQRDHYFRYLDLVVKTGFNRGKMMATVFLGKQERYNEQWATMADEEEAKFKSKEKEKEEDYPMPSTETIDDRRKKYEDTNK